MKISCENAEQVALYTMTTQVIPLGHSSHDWALRSVTERPPPAPGTKVAWQQEAASQPHNTLRSRLLPHIPTSVPCVSTIPLNSVMNI